MILKLCFFTKIRKKFRNLYKIDNCSIVHILYLRKKTWNKKKRTSKSNEKTYKC